MKIICENPLSLQQLLLIQILFTMKIYKSCLLAVALLATTPVCLFAQDDTLPEYDAARAWTPDKNEQKTFNCGYLFLQDIYYSLGLDKICSKISSRHLFEYDLNDILSKLVYTRVIFPSSKLSSNKLAASFIEFSMG